MKIAMQQSAYYPWIGGAEIFAQKVAEHLVRGGHEVDMITGLWDKPDIFTKSWNKKHENINGVDIYRTKTVNIRNLKSLSCLFPIAYKTIKLDKKKDYDVIHSHIFPAMQSGTIVQKIRKKPHIITVQGGDLVDYEETTAKFGGILKPLISLSLKNANIVHAVSTHTQKRAIELGAKNTIMIPNGVDIKEYKPMPKDKLREKYGFSQDEQIIISTSRLTPKNGIDCLIKAVSVLKKPDIKLLILGDGDQRPELKALIRDLKLEEIVKLLGYIPRKKVIEYLNIADVFAKPSIDEGFGISFIEAMACKIPIIGTNVGGIPDIIKDGVNGFMVPPKNVDELSNVIINLLEDEDLKKRVAEASYKTVKEKFSWEIVLKKIDKVYQSIWESHT